MGNAKSQLQDPDDSAMSVDVAKSVQAKPIDPATTDFFSQNKVLGILEEIVHSQEQMKAYLKGLTKDLCSQDVAFEDTYARVKEAQPNDPLEQHSLSMAEFDQLLDMYHNDPSVQAAVAKIRGVPNLDCLASANVLSINVDTIVKVHLFMLEQLESLVQHHLQDKSFKEDNYDMKLVAIVVQAVIGAKVQGKFGITSEEIEGAVLMHCGELTTNQEFTKANARISNTMSTILHGFGRASFMKKGA